MERTRTINVILFAKFQAFMTGLLGVVAGILYSFGGLIYDLAVSGSVNWGTALAFLALIGMPVIFWAFGFLAGVFEALLYNLYASKFGRREIDFF